MQNRKKKKNIFYVVVVVVAGPFSRKEIFSAFTYTSSQH